ncbi:hypothetical protein Tco_1045304 [Tanacetum coccineum]|uniref:Uncharacterized protein n=1 Tax=Tanacetum coccineum TaxID=301880 RepID=A0ABQ5GSW9_9ASTR
MSSYNHFGCSYCGGPFNGGNCPSCSSVGSGNEFVYDPNPYSYNETPNFFNQPPQYQYETYSCEFCGGNSHPGYDCQTGNTPVFDQGPCYNQDFGFNQPLHYSPSQPQQFPCSENCGGPHATFQCQPMNQNFYNSFGFDQFQPPQYPVIHHPPQETSEEVLQARENLMKSIQTFLNKFNRYPFGEIPKVLLVAWERFSEIKHVFTDKQYQPEDIQELMRKLLQDLQNISEELAEYINSPSWNRPAFYFNDDDDDEYTIIYRSTKAITHNLPTEEPEYSLSMGDEHPNTILETESDELMKSSVENLVPIPSESKDIFDDECELPLCDDSPKTQFTTFSNHLFDSNDDFSSSDDESFSKEDVPIEEFKIYSNPLFDFDEEIISSEENSISNEVLDEINSIPPRMNDCFNVESDLIESFLNRDTSIDSFHEIDSLFDEFAEKLILLKPISLEIDNSDFDPEGEIRLIKRLLYDNSSPRPPEDLSIKSFSPSLSPLRIVTLLWRRSTYFLLQMIQHHRVLKVTMTRKETFFFLKNCLTITLFPFPSIIILPLTLSPIRP